MKTLIGRPIAYFLFLDVYQKSAHTSIKNVGLRLWLMARPLPNVVEYGYQYLVINHIIVQFKIPFSNRLHMFLYRVIYIFFFVQNTD